MASHIGFLYIQILQQLHYSLFEGVFQSPTTGPQFTTRRPETAGRGRRLSDHTVSNWVTNKGGYTKPVFCENDTDNHTASFMCAW